jgi:Double zinc ribbon
MVCTACGSPNEADSLFCEQCGASLERRCPACSTAVKAEARFCRKCGHNLLEAAEPRPDTPTTDRPRGGASSLEEKLDQLQRYLPTYLVQKILATRGRLEGERKVVAVLFADLVGYTGLSERLGEEALFTVMTASSSS